VRGRESIGEAISRLAASVLAGVLLLLLTAGSAAPSSAVIGQLCAPDVSGSWTVKAAWDGDATHFGSQTTCTIQVF
jgi:hypothetical protein